MKKIQYLILGAGPTGLGAAHRLKGLGVKNFLVAEKLAHAGGLATSYVDDKGFTWDIGGHVQFSHYAYFDQVMDEALGVDGWNHHQRESWVWIKNRFVPYPFQNNIHRLPKSDQDRILADLENPGRNQKQELANFRDWLAQSFGESLCQLFMYPYNFKVWAFDPAKMNYKWIGERVATVDVARIKENIKLNRDDVSWGPNSTFRFPKSGGTGAIWRSVAQQIGAEHFLYEEKLVGIDANLKVATFASGLEISYECLLSTLPLDKLYPTIANAPTLSSLSAHAQKMVYSTTNIVGVGIEGTPPSELKTKCWMYFPESNSPFYRVTVFSNYAQANVPANGSFYSLMTEVSESCDKPVNQETLVDEVLQGLKACKLMSENAKVASIWSFRAPHGYPTPFLERDQLLKDLIPPLQEFQIYSRGRFGGWKYEVSNQDHSFMQGVEWANLMVNHEPESTYQL